MGDIYKKAADRGDVCVTVVLPTLNEAEVLPKVVEELRAAGYDKILVVDGGSTDGNLGGRGARRRRGDADRQRQVDGAENRADVRRHALRRRYGR